MPGPRKHLPASERRDATVAAVVELAGETDPNTLTTARIAAHMGLTQGALFRHFPSKDDIWRAVMEWVAERLTALAQSAARHSGSPMANLESLFMAHVAFVARHPGAPRVLFAEMQRGKDTPAKATARNLLGEYGQRISALVEQGKTQGEIARDVDPHMATTLFLGAIQGLVVQSLLIGDFHRVMEDAAGVLALFSNGIRRSP